MSELLAAAREVPLVSCAGSAGTTASALAALATWLRAGGYAFVPPTPETHRRNNAREGALVARSIRDAFGWSRAFEASLLPDRLFEQLQDADLIVREPHGRYRSRVRFASLDDDLYAHSAYPTSDADSVFFGPDTYRFVRFIAQATRGWTQDTRVRRTVVDVGCGSGAGGLAAWRLLGQRDRIVLADINERALVFAQANAHIAQAGDVECVRSDVLRDVQGDADLIVSNPPYMCDAQARLYRHGGALHGGELSLRIVRESLARLRPGGCLALYTGAAVVDGHDVLREAVTPLLRASGLPWSYDELDPDVFGEELESPLYADVERIAAVGLTVYNTPARESAQ